MLNEKLPIGVFDSGIGGLTVANAIHQLLPKENLIYFGDTAHLPYGDKSAAAIKGYVRRIAAFLLENKCKMIVIACNTASAVGFSEVQKMMPDRSLAINVIDPVVEHLASLPDHGRIGVIATKRTVSTHAYARKIKKSIAHAEVAELATPLLAPMIEEGFFNNKISQTIINSYLSKKKLHGIQSLVLACTHYPLIQPEIEKYYQKKVHIIDSASVVAKKVAASLENKGLLNEKGKPQHRFYVSDYTKSFEHTAKIFFKEKITLMQHNLWKDE